MPLRMKGGQLRIISRGKELSLVLIFLVCTTILFWAWDKSPLLTSLLPPKSQLLQLSPEERIPLKDTINKEANHLDEVTPEDPTKSSSYLVPVPSKKGQEAKHKHGLEDGSAKSGLSLKKKEVTDSIILEKSNSKQEDKRVENLGQEAKHKHGLEDGSAESGLSLKNKEVTDSIILEKDNSKQENKRVENPVFLDPDAKPPLPPLSPLGVAGQEAKHKHGLEDGSAASGLSLKNKEVTDSIILEKSKSKQEDKRVENPACNYAKGKWVVDDRRPLYSGSKCKQWLAPMWACRLMQRQDFAYEKLRWQPKDCQMEEFEGSKFLERMQDKTLAFVGDSLGRQQFLSLMCMITAGKKRTDVLDVGKEYGFIIAPGSKRPNGWAYRFPSTNTTVLFYWSSCLCDLECLNVTDPLTEYAMHLDRPPAFLHQFLHKIDVLVLNTGHHWNRGKLRGNRWVMYVGGVPNTNRKIADMGGAKNFTVHNTVNWVNSQLPKHPRLKAFYRSISPRHFMNGDWNTGGSCDSTTPMSIGKEVLQEESSDDAAASAVRGTGVKLLDITALSQVRDEGHISRFSITATPGVQDCLHWCLPGVPDTWNELLFAQI